MPRTFESDAVDRLGVLTTQFDVLLIEAFTDVRNARGHGTGHDRRRASGADRSLSRLRVRAPDRILHVRRPAPALVDLLLRQRGQLVAQFCASPRQAPERRGTWR